MTSTNAERDIPTTGRPSDYDDAQVIAAGEQLREEGRRITGYALRRILGGGDPRRHSRIWEKHQSQQDVVESEPVQELPVEVEEKLKQLTAELVAQIHELAIHLNTTAVKTAERRVSDVMNSAREQQDQAEAELADAALTVEDLEEQLAHVRAERNKANHEAQRAVADNETFRGRINALERDLAVSNEKLEAEHDQRETAEKALQELQNLNAELKQDKTELRAEREQLQGQVIKLQDKVETLQDERDNLTNTRAELKTQLAGMAEREAGLVQRTETAEADKREAMKDSKELEQRAIKAESSAEHLQKQLDILMKRVSVSEGGPSGKAAAKRPGSKSS